MKREILIGVVSSLLTAFVAVVLSTGMGLFEKTLSDSQIQEVAKLVVDTDNYRQVLLGHMKNSRDFVGPPGEKGDKGEAGIQGVPGPKLELGISTQVTLERRNSAGTTSQLLHKTARTFCFLTKVSVEDIDTVGEYASCEISKDGDGTSWQLEAKLGRGGGPDSDVVCEATCISW